MAASVSALSLEGYLQVLDALTAEAPGGGGCAVRAVTPIEEHFFKVGDLRQVLQIHGLTAAKFVRGEMLRAMVGARLMDPSDPPRIDLPPPPPPPGQDASAGPASGPPAAAAAGAAAAGGQQAGVLQAADLIALGWASGAPEQLQAELDAAPVLRVPRLEGAAAPGPEPQQQQQQPPPLPAAPAPANAAADPAAVQYPLAPGPAAAGLLQPSAAQPPAAWPGSAPPAASGASAAAPAPAPAAAGAPPALDQHALLALLQQHGLLPAGIALPAAAAGGGTIPGAGAGAAPLQAAAALPPPPPAAQAVGSEGAAGGGAGSGGSAAGGAPAAAEPPAPSGWLHGQIQVFERLPGCRVSQEALGEGAAAALAGRRVGFVLVDEMEVAVGRGATLKLPPGLFQGRAIRFLGTSCRPGICEAACAAPHFFYAAKIIPPTPESLAAMAAAAPAALAAAGGADNNDPGGGGGGGEGAAACGAADYAAALGRPVELELDLHPRLRRLAAQELMALEAEHLQDAWLLLEQQEQLPSVSDAESAGMGGGGCGGGGGGAGGGELQAAACRRRRRPQDALLSDESHLPPLLLPPLPLPLPPLLLLLEVTHLEVLVAASQPHQPPLPPLLLEEDEELEDSEAEAEAEPVDQDDDDDDNDELEELEEELEEELVPKQLALEVE